MKLGSLIHGRLACPTSRSATPPRSRRRAHPPQQASKVGHLGSEQAAADLAVGRQPGAVTRRAEGMRHRSDDTKLSARLGRSTDGRRRPESAQPERFRRIATAGDQRRWPQREVAGAAPSAAPTSSGRGATIPDERARPSFSPVRWCPATSSGELLTPHRRSAVPSGDRRFRLRPSQCRQSPP